MLSTYHGVSLAAQESASCVYVRAYVLSNIRTTSTYIEPYASSAVVALLRLTKSAHEKNEYITCLRFR
jgi:hypothetical protein